MAFSSSFTVNGAANPAEHTVAYGATVSLALVSLDDIGSVEFSIIAPSKSNQTIPTVTPSGIPSGVLASFVMPADPSDGLGRAFRVQCKATSNGGVISYSYGVVGAVNARGQLPLTAFEELDRGPYGAVDTINSMGGTTGALGAQATNTALLNVTGSSAVPSAGDIQLLTATQGTATAKIAPYPTMADLRAVTPVSGRTAETQGHTTAGDGGGGRWIGMTGAAATWTHDGGITIVPSSGTGSDGSRAWVRQFSGPIDVRWYGVVAYPTRAACVTAGGSYHTQVQAAVTAASVSGKPVEITGWTRLGGKVTVPHGVKMIGPGRVNTSTLVGAGGFVKAPFAAEAFDFNGGCAVALDWVVWCESDSTTVSGQPNHVDAVLVTANDGHLRLAVAKAPRDGIRLGVDGAGSNANTTHLDKCNVTESGRHGFRLHANAGTAPDVNSCLMTNCHSRNNIGDGFSIGNAYLTTMIAPLGENNAGYGLNCSDKAWWVDITGGDFEGNGTATAWAPATVYAAGAKVNNDSGKGYIALTGGTSAGSGGPTGTGTGITDGGTGLTWAYLAPMTLGDGNVNIDDGAREVKIRVAQYSEPWAMAADDPTPHISGRSFVQCANTGTTRYTDFLGTSWGDEFDVRLDGYAIIDADSIKTLDGFDITGNANMIVRIKNLLGSLRVMSKSQETERLFKLPTVPGLASYFRGDDPTATIVAGSPSVFSSIPDRGPMFSIGTSSNFVATSTARPEVATRYGKQCVLFAADPQRMQSQLNPEFYRAQSDPDSFCITAVHFRTPGTLTGYQTILSTTPYNNTTVGFGLTIISGDLYCWIANASGGGDPLAMRVSGGTLAINTDYTVVIWKRGNIVTWYLNGALVGSSTTLTAPSRNNPSYSLVIGNRGSGGGESFGGHVYDVSVHLTEGSLWAVDQLRNLFVGKWA